MGQKPMARVFGAVRMRRALSRRNLPVRHRLQYP